MKRHVHYEKPSEKRARQKAEAVRRARKLARKRAQREGLLPATPRPVRPGRPRPPLVLHTPPQAIWPGAATVSISAVRGSGLRAAFFMRATTIGPRDEREPD